MIFLFDFVLILFGRIKVVFFPPSFLIIILWKFVMDQSFKNENKVNANETCEFFMYDVLEERFEENLIVQTKTNKNPKDENE